MGTDTNMDAATRFAYLRLSVEWQMPPTAEALLRPDLAVRLAAGRPLLLRCWHGLPASLGERCLAVGHSPLIELYTLCPDPECQMAAWHVTEHAGGGGDTLLAVHYARIWGFELEGAR